MPPENNTSTTALPVHRALISVSDKTGIADFARALHQLGIQILSTGGTFRLLQEHNIPAVEVSDYTGFVEIMDGRIKTLHPKIHGGILARRDQDENLMQAHNILPIDMVVVNLYPFSKTIAQPDCTLEQAIENIDIGGPSMLRAAAKNHAWVCSVVDTDDYGELLQDLQQHQGISSQKRFSLATKSFRHCANYDTCVADYLEQRTPDAEETQNLWPEKLNLSLQQHSVLRYGENPHQKAAFYTTKAVPGSIAQAQQLQGKALSYNNIVDADAALSCVQTFTQPACVIVKHANPCGVAVSDNLLTAYEQAWETDTTSAFGGIIAINRPLTQSLAQAIMARQFVEVIIAPAVDTDALSVLAKKANIRVLSCGNASTNKTIPWHYKSVSGGILVQESDMQDALPSHYKTVTERPLTPQELLDAQFAWKVANYVKSNAIVYAKQERTLGIGAGQMSRVYSARIAAIKAQDAGLNIAGAVMASDAFFPFPDSIEDAAQAGVSAIIQPGGSIRDDAVIEAANRLNIAMVFTGMRHFRH